jgi:hypothetical protein
VYLTSYIGSEKAMSIIKIQKMNGTGALGNCLPKEHLEKLGWKAGDYVNIVRVGNTLHVTKVEIE